jgi:hypothetical protein
VRRLYALQLRSRVGRNLQSTFDQKENHGSVAENPQKRRFREGLLSGLRRVRARRSRPTWLVSDARARRRDRLRPFRVVHFAANGGSAKMSA